MISFFKNKENTMEVTVSNRTVIRVVVLVIISFLLLAAVRKAGHALTLIFVAIFLSIALNAPVHKLAQRIPGKRKGNRVIATALSFLAVVLMLAGFLASIVPPIVRQTTSFIDRAPQIVRDVRSENSGLGKTVRKYHLQDQVQKFSSQLGDRLKNLTGSVVGTFGKVTSSVFSILTVLVLTFMMLIEGPRWLDFARRLMPPSQEDHAEELAHAMYRVVKGYVNGQVLLAFIAACLIFPALIILHIDYPVALLVVVFICGLIPLVGHTIGAIIVTTVALFHSPATAVIILAYYILYQQVENYAIQPRIQANSTDMSPLLVFISVIIGVSFNGLLGGLVAIPIAGCIRILVLDYLNSRNLLEPDQKQVLAKAESK
jgi:predicted PurR-regulated permease PerM